MNKTFTIAFVVLGGIVLSALIFGAGLMVGRSNLGWSGYAPGDMMRGISGNNNSAYSMMGNENGSGMMGGNGNGMMGGNGNGMMGGNGNGMMGGNGNGMMGGNGNGMMGNYRSGVGSNVKPLTVDQAKKAVEDYLKRLNNPDLELKEIMVFDNNAYARITEKSTGIGAMELLVDPASLAVFPEYGPNMMWNLKYGHMSGTGGMMGGNGNGMMGGNGNGMMGGYNNNTGSAAATMTVTADQAAKIAQQYLDQQFPGSTAATDPDPFFGYYTIDILKDGKPTGMLSVNGFSGQVFLHTWHGTFIEMSE